MFERESHSVTQKKKEGRGRSHAHDPADIAFSLAGKHGFTGFELPVLQSFSWTVPLHVVTIENNINNQKIDRMLVSHGFQYFADYETNNIWVNCSWWKRCRI